MEITSAMIEMIKVMVTMFMYPLSVTIEIIDFSAGQPY